MSEELLKAIVQLFAIVAKERVTEDERENMRDFLSVHLNQEAIGFYLGLFDKYCNENELEQREDINLDNDTLEFVEDWGRIMAIIKQVNTALTMQQKVVLVIKIIALVHADNDISERQQNLIFYIGEGLKLSRKDMISLRRFVTGQDLEELAAEDLLIIDEGSGSYDFNGPRLVAKNLTGLIAILRLPQIETYFIKYLGISALTHNGIPIKSRKIDIFPTGSTIRGNKIKTIYYSDVVGAFLQGKVESRITFSAEHIFYQFKNGRPGLQDVNIAVKGAKLIGIMGASGSGKTTLLNVINGSEKPFSGRVIINGIDIYEDPRAVEGVIGHIPQDDLLIEELTVFENLYYSAQLCFGHYSNEETAQLTNKVLVNLGLIEIKDLKVGSPMDKTISGGQRKRVNIGLELLRESSILFVDEPTSGLSSRDSENIMDLLKDLSLRGKMVFVVIHQPSSDIFKMFDELLILDVGGLQIYSGNPTDAVLYFKEIVNAANKNQSACPECGNINPEQIFNIIETKVVNEFGRLTTTRKISPAQWYQYFRRKINPERLTHVKEPFKVLQVIPNRLRQFKIYLQRDLFSKLSNRQYMVINLLQAPVLALFMAFLVRYNATAGVDNAAYSFYENDNIPVYFFMSIIVALFMGLTVSAEEIFRDRKIRKRERFLNLSRSSYLSSKICLLFIISAIQTASFVIIGNEILEIEGMGVRLWLILFSCSCFANMVGLNVSASFNSAVTIYILIPVLLIPQLLLSGVVISFDKFNPHVSNLEGVPVIGEIMASRWAFEAAMVTQFKDNYYERQFYEQDKQAANAEYKKLYYIPRLESELAYAFNNLHSTDTAAVKRSLMLLRNGIAEELEGVGKDKFEIAELTYKAFDSATYVSTTKFLNTLQQMYINRYNEALAEKTRIADRLAGSLDNFDRLDSLRIRYQNEAVMQAVQNDNILHRIIELDGKLIQKIYPVYFEDFEPKNAFDFRTKFFAPKKHFAGFYIDTLYFNIAVIWMMSLLLFITLYYKVLRLFLNLFAIRKRNRN